MKRQCVNDIREEQTITPRPTRLWTAFDVPIADGLAECPLPNELMWRVLGEGWTAGSHLSIALTCRQFAKWLQEERFMRYLLARGRAELPIACPETIVPAPAMMMPRERRDGCVVSLLSENPRAWAELPRDSARTLEYLPCVAMCRTVRRLMGTSIDAVTRQQLLAITWRTTMDAQTIRVTTNDAVGRPDATRLAAQELYTELLNDPSRAEQYPERALLARALRMSHEETVIDEPHAAWRALSRELGLWSSDVVSSKFLPVNGSARPTQADLECPVGYLPGVALRLDEVDAEAKTARGIQSVHVLEKMAYVWFGCPTLRHRVVAVLGRGLCSVRAMKPQIDHYGRLLSMLMHDCVDLDADALLRVCRMYCCWRPEKAQSTLLTLFEEVVVRRHLPPSRALREYVDGGSGRLCPLIERYGIERCCDEWGFALSETMAIAWARSSSDLLRFWHAKSCHTLIPWGPNTTEKLQTILAHPLWKNHTAEDAMRLLGYALEGSHIDYDKYLPMLETVCNAEPKPAPLRIKEQLLDRVRRLRERPHLGDGENGSDRARWTYDGTCLAYLVGRRPAQSDLDAETLWHVGQRSSKRSWDIAIGVALVVQHWPETLATFVPLYEMLLECCAKHALMCPQRITKRTVITSSLWLTQLLYALAARTNVSIPADYRHKCEHCTSAIRELVAARPLRTVS
jgi:hypothetical protein